FPYILMKPRLILAAIAGGLVGTLTFSLLNAGLVTTPSPGSIFAYMAMTPRGEFFQVISGIITATAASFVVAAFLLKTGKDQDDIDLDEAKTKMAQMKSE